jgi:mono/diheme cytochrome c family protein
VRAFALLTVLAGALFLSAQSGQVLTPAYQAGFNGAEAMLKDIRDEIRGLRADLRSGGAGGQSVSVESLVKARCASCHSADAAPEKGGDFVMVEGDKVIDFRPLERRRIAAKVRAGQMPPGAPLPENEKKAFESITQGAKK